MPLNLCEFYDILLGKGRAVLGTQTDCMYWCAVKPYGRGHTILTSCELTPSLSFPMRWLSYADLYNLVTWCHVKRFVGTLFSIGIFSISGNNW